MKSPNARLVAPLLLLAFIHVAALDPFAAERATGPLRVHPDNPRYFTDGSGKAVYLTGTHTWDNLVDIVNPEAPVPFDYEAYLDFLEAHNHNFIRMWAWDSTTWDTRANRNLGKDFVHVCAPQPWERTGPGSALDGKPKFDLTKFNQAYFDRLRERVEAAGDRGIYVSVMLFEGWGLLHGNQGRAAPAGWAWHSHPFHPDNNVSGIDGDADGDGVKGEVHSKAIPAVNEIQDAYIRKVVDTVNDLDNVLYEVVNEGGVQEWDWWVVETVKAYERTKPKQHPVGLTGHGTEDVASMLASPADWISPGSKDGYRDPAPAWDGKKVSLLDTDHIWGIGGTHQWVWRSFLRGHNVLFMDPYEGSILGTPGDPQWVPLRKAMGVARQLADRLDLAAMAPHEELASTGFCLANPGKAYVAYLAEGGEVEIDLTKAKGEVQVTWIHPVDGTRTPGSSLGGGAKRTLSSPLAKDAVVYLRVSTAGQAAAAATAREPKPRNWVDTQREAPNGTQIRTFASKTVGQDVSYILYLPPDYEANAGRRYPVLYWLHGLNGTQYTGADFVVPYFDAAIREGIAPPMIAILINGMIDSFYCDSQAGDSPVESIIINDLIPHVDSTYRTIPEREARAIEGYSMGGWGAAHLGFKYPDLFGTVCIDAGALLQADALRERHSEIYDRIFGADERFLAEHPRTLVEKNADKVRGRTHIRISVGGNDPLLQVNQDFHTLLVSLGIEHEYQVVPDVAHMNREYHRVLGAQGFAFYSKALGELAQTPG